MTTTAAVEAQIEYALMVDAADMARLLYAGRPSWTVSRKVNPWCYADSLVEVSQ